jgi:outer membrane protein OmpA-like peptidoglycan-associated protein
MTADEQPPPSAANDEASALATLKTLLVGPELNSIERLEEESRDPEVQQQRVADSLPKSISKAYQDSPAELTRSLELPVAECIEGSVERNPALFADILYPVMGPAIRRSITQAMRELVQHINQSLEHSLTLKGLKWRIEAMRSGIPFAEIVLRHTLRYRVDEVFLIQSGSGLLIQHVSKDPAHATDADAVSAMLTAIRDFAHDTLDAEDENSRLETIDVGEHTLWLIHGPKAYLACAIRGVPPVGLRDELAAVLEQIHRRQPALLENFDGDPAGAAPAVTLMQTCLRSETTEQSGKGFPWPLLLVLLLITGLVAWWGFGQWQAHAKADGHQVLQTATAKKLSTMPGIVLTDWRISDGQLQLQGLHDPLSPTPESVLLQSGLAPADYSLNFHPFQSSDPAAALARAKQRLAPPDALTLKLDADGTLSASGFATRDWANRAALLATTVPGVARYDDSGLGNIDDQVQKQLYELLQPPEQVRITVTGGIAQLAGEAPLAWISSLPQQPPPIAGLDSMQHENLRPQEARRLAALIEMIEASTIDFTSGIELDEQQQAKIASLAAWVSEAHQHAQDLNRHIELQIIGRTDGTGSSKQNIYISHGRATRVAQALTAAAAPMPELRLHSIMQPPGRPDAEMRRVEFRVGRDLGLSSPLREVR